VSSGLQKPAGIAIQNNRLLVSDYETGKIHVYDISAMPATELFQIQTPAAGIMGIVLNPDGKIVYADHDNSEIVMITPGVLGTNSAESEIGLYPNPASQNLHLTGNLKGISSIAVVDLAGRIISSPAIEANGLIDISNLASGTYFLSVMYGKSLRVHTIKWIKF
jgi:DNA-binding beta-propeller fold protein YncE